MNGERITYDTGTRALEQETIQHLFSRAVRDHGGKDLIISDADGSVFTYADTGEVVRRVMSALCSEGVKKGDIVCIYSPANVESFFLFWASANLGAVFVPLDFNWPERMLERVLAQIRPKLFFCERASYVGSSTIKDRARTILFDEPVADEEALPDTPGFSRWLDSADGETHAAKISPDDDAVILFTSGSTGDPKGVVLSQGALYRCGRMVNRLYGWTSADILLSHGDMHAIGGLRYAAVAALHAGCSFLITPIAQRANVFLLAERIRKHRCTQLTTVPIEIRQFVRFKDRIHPSDLGSLRAIVSGGSSLAPDLVDSFYEHFHVPVLDCYGLTETAGLCIGHSPESFQQAHGSIGLPVGCLVSIVDADGNVLEDGATGELRIRSENIMSGYYLRPDLTRMVIRDGWLYTGDLAMKRVDGQIVLMGRIKNAIKHANGDLICFEEVEAALEKHQRVREAAVCGYVSNRGDERLAAFIVPDAGPMDASDLFRELRNYIREELGLHKVPAVFLVKDHLPRSSSDCKVLREQLKMEIKEP